MAEKRLTCNLCDEEWESSFFCDMCSQDGDWVWSDVDCCEVYRPAGNVCGNCCVCHHYREFCPAPTTDEGK